MMTQAEMAKALNLSKGYVAKLCQDGMPRSSVEDAQAWREQQAKRKRSSVPVPVRNIERLVDDSLASVLENHRRLVQRARDVYLGAIESGDPGQSKLQTAYNQALRTLVALEDEEAERAIQAKEYIKMTEAQDLISKWTAKVVARLEKLPLDCAEACNGDRPETAIKVLERWVNEVRQDLSK